MVNLSPLPLKQYSLLTTSLNAGEVVSFAIFIADSTSALSQDILSIYVP
jgi:hypothetical protein